MYQTLKFCSSVSIRFYGEDLRLKKPVRRTGSLLVKINDEKMKINDSFIPLFLFYLVFITTHETDCLGALFNF